MTTLESSGLLCGRLADCHINEPNRDNTRGRSMRLSGAVSTSCRLQCWTQLDYLVQSLSMDLA